MKNEAFYIQYEVNLAESILDKLKYNANIEDTERLSELLAYQDNHLSLRDIIDQMIIARNHKEDAIAL